MAFEFFRRRQKLVIGVMVVLMVAFLLSSALTNLRGCGPRERDYGTALGGDVEIDDASLAHAKRDIALLSRSPIALGSQNRLQQQRLWPHDVAFATLTRAQRSTSDDEVHVGEVIAYALLVAEAEHRGARASDSEIDDFLTTLGITGQNYTNFLVEARSEPMLMSEEEVRATIGRWVTVFKHFRNATPTRWPSEAEIREAFRDRYEKVQVRIAVLPAEAYIAKTDEPTDDEVRMHIQQYARSREGNYRTGGPFGFGYLSPQRLTIDYLLIRTDVLEQVVEPDEEEVSEYYRTHRQEFARREPVEVDGNDPNASRVFRTVTPSLGQAWDEVVEKVRPIAARRMTERIARSVRSLTEEYGQARREASDPGSFPERYPWVADRLRVSPQSLLGRKVTVTIPKMPMREALNRLARSAGLDAIAWPAETIADPNDEVSLTADGLTLGQALEGLTEQVQEGRLAGRVRWQLCSEVSEVLFPVTGVNLFPVVARRETGLTAEEVREHDLFSNASLQSGPGGDSFGTVLGRLVASRARQGDQDEPLGPQPGAPMYVTGPLGDQEGKFFWSLVEVSPPRAPEQVTEPLARQAKRELRDQAAYELALADANEVDTPAEFSDLVQAQDLETVETGLINRFDALPRPGAMVWARLARAGLTVPARDQQAELIRTAFELPGMWTNPAEVGKDRMSGRIAAVGLPSARAVALVQLMDFRRALKPVFDSPQVRQQLIGQLMQDRMMGIYSIWFHPRNISIRTGYKARATR